MVRFGNSLDIALLGYQHNLACLCSSETEGAAGLKPGEHFNYNHSITTLCFKVREVNGRKGSGRKLMPTITPNDPSTPCYSTKAWSPGLRGLEIIKNNNIIILGKKCFYLLTAAVWLMDWCSTVLKTQLGMSLESASAIIVVMDFQEEITADYWFYSTWCLKAELSDYIGLNVHAGSSVAPQEVRLDLEAVATSDKLWINHTAASETLTVCEG